MGRYFERAEMKFLGRVGGRRQVDQRERRLGELLPDREIIGRDGEPAIPEHVPSGLGDASGSLPCDLVDHRLAPRRRVSRNEPYHHDPPA